jgi:hypothetical protein
MRKITDKDLLIETEATEDISVIKRLNFGKVDLKIKLPRKVGPCIIVYDVEKNKTKEEIRNNLWNKNLIRAGINKSEYDNKIMFWTSLGNKNSSLVNWIIEVPARIYLRYFIGKRKSFYTIEFTQSTRIHQYSKILQMLWFWPSL